MENDTTVARFIRRFREAKPLPPQQRLQQRPGMEEEFWWLRRGHEEELQPNDDHIRNPTELQPEGEMQKQQLEVGVTVTSASSAEPALVNNCDMGTCSPSHPDEVSAGDPPVELPCSLADSPLAVPEQAGRKEQLRKFEGEGEVGIQVFPTTPVSTVKEDIQDGDALLQAQEVLQRVREQTLTPLPLPSLQPLAPLSSAWEGCPREKFPETTKESGNLKDIRESKDEAKGRGTEKDSDKARRMGIGQPVRDTNSEVSVDLVDATSGCEEDGATDLSELDTRASTLLKRCQDLLIGKEGEAQVPLEMGHADTLSFSSHGEMALPQEQSRYNLGARALQEFTQGISSLSTARQEAPIPPYLSPDSTVHTPERVAWSGLSIDSLARSYTLSTHDLLQEDLHERLLSLGVLDVDGGRERDEDINATFVSDKGLGKSSKRSAAERNGFAGVRKLGSAYADTGSERRAAVETLRNLDLVSDPEPELIKGAPSICPRVGVMVDRRDSQDLVAEVLGQATHGEAKEEAGKVAGGENEVWNEVKKYSRERGQDKEHSQGSNLCCEHGPTRQGECNRRDSKESLGAGHCCGCRVYIQTTPPLCTESMVRNPREVGLSSDWSHNTKLPSTAVAPWEIEGKGNEMERKVVDDNVEGERQGSESFDGCCPSIEEHKIGRTSSLSENERSLSVAQPSAPVCVGGKAESISCCHPTLADESCPACNAKVESSTIATAAGPIPTTHLTITCDLVPISQPTCQRTLWRLPFRETAPKESRLLDNIDKDKSVVEGWAKELSLEEYVDDPVIKALLQQAREVEIEIRKYQQGEQCQQQRAS
ncbi:unnamed protein product [Choristocarpus tenellus]